MNDTKKRALSKGLFWLGGWLMRVKTYRRWYALDSADPPMLVPGGWHWSPCVFGVKLLERSMQLDWDHWDHWACRHTECSPRACPDCGGCRCDDDPGDAA